MNILLVCHAGTGVGLGHMTRCLVAAKALKHELGADVQMLIQGDEVKWSELATWPHRFIGHDENLVGHVRAWQAQGPLDVLVFDLQPQKVPPDFGDLLDGLRASGCALVAVDGLLRYRPKLDLIFTPSFHLALAHDTPDGAPIVMGWDCLLLNVQVAPRGWQPGRRVLALTGGSDATSLGKTWPRLLDDTLPPDTELHWVTGPFAAAPSLPDAPRIDIHEHVAPTGLGPLMQASDYAVTVFGISFFELMYLGIPTVVFSPYGGKDNRELEGIAQSGAALVACDETDASHLLVGLMHDDALARQLSRQSRALLSTSGASRLCAEILKLTP
jgi:spore coat polysaccharide biosynthesis predicted glycosyltransferase SpsG